MKKAIFAVLLILVLGVFLFSGWKVLSTIWEYKAGEDFYADLEQFISVPEPQETKPEAEKQNPPSKKEEKPAPEAQPDIEDEVVWPKVDFDALLALNPDVVGWLYIPGTRVNYPVLQGDTNDSYIYRLMTGEYNSSGSIFLEAGISPEFTSRNNPIYGHHMKNGTMFADVADYRDQSYYDAHPYALLLTPEKNYYVRIFSGYVTDTWDDVWDTAFSEAEFAQWLEKASRNSYFDADVIPTPSDRIVTLSTCTYEYDNARFVVHGILEACDGE